MLRFCILFIEKAGHCASTLCACLVRVWVRTEDIASRQAMAGRAGQASRAGRAGWAGLVLVRAGLVLVRAEHTVFEAGGRTSYAFI